MMSEILMNEIMTCITSKYHSLNSPNYEFISKESKKPTYHKVRDDLLKSFYIREFTDLNDDVSIFYSIKSDQDNWGLFLSFIGKYACLLCVERECLRIVSQDNYNKDNKNEILIVQFLKQYNIRILNKDILEKPIKMNLEKTSLEHVCIFHALFTDTEILPWKSFEQCRVDRLFDPQYSF